MAEDRDERDRNQEREDAIWEQLVASFDREPSSLDTPPWPDAETLDDDAGTTGARTGGGQDEHAAAEPGPEDDAGPGDDGDAVDGDAGEQDPGDDGVNTTRSILVATGPVHWPRELGPRDFETADEEEHFVPPPPPPLPKLDTTTKFAWLAVLGGPLLLIVLVLLQQPIEWWAATLGIGGFLGGFGTLVARMKDRDDEEDDPDAGAVV